jgi:hypothetical protein
MITNRAGAEHRLLYFSIVIQGREDLARLDDFLGSRSLKTPSAVVMIRVRAHPANSTSSLAIASLTSCFWASVTGIRRSTLFRDAGSFGGRAM